MFKGKHLRRLTPTPLTSFLILALQCSLVKVNVLCKGGIQFSMPLTQYCSPRCQIQHAPVHRIVCQNVFLDSDWKRCCTVEQRNPILGQKTIQIQPSVKHVLWSLSPAFDCIQLNFNEGLDAKDLNFRLCFAGT
jgi:hypothetical protein